MARLLRFYACGGDGTVNEVANGIIGYDNASMTVIPVGTGNDFLKNFGPEDMEKFRDAENLWDAPQFPIDAIDVNGRIALTIACSGIDARVAKDVHNFSESPILDGKSSYIVSLMVNFLFKSIGSHWTVELDGERTNLRSFPGRQSRTRPEGHQSDHRSQSLRQECR